MDVPMKAIFCVGFFDVHPNATILAHFRMDNFSVKRRGFNHFAMCKKKNGSARPIRTSDPG
jgi:hypothetical protein